MAKKKKNTKTDKGNGSKKAVSKKNLPLQKKNVKKQASKKVTKKPVKKKLPSKKASKPSTKKKTELKTGAGFASNNFNYIRALIWAEYGLDYVSYFDPEFIRVIREVYNECKAVGRECSDRDILLIYDDVRENPQRPYPYIEEDLFQSARQYYEILDVEFNLFPAYLWISSPMIIPEPSEFIVTQYYNKEGNTDKGYKKYFKEFVDWANKATREKNEGNVDSSDVDIYIKFTQPEYDEEKQRWESEIFICTEEGIMFSFGFVPKGREFEHDAGEEFIEPIEETLEIDGETVKPIVEKEKPIEPTPIPLTPEQIKKKQKSNSELFSALINLTTKYEQLEKKAEKEKEKQKKAKQKAKDTSKKKDNELKRLQKIKKEIQSTIRLYKNIGDKKRLNKALKDLDDVMNKIKKLT